MVFLLLDARRQRQWQVVIRLLLLQPLPLTRRYMLPAGHPQWRHQSQVTHNDTTLAHVHAAVLGR